MSIKEINVTHFTPTTRMLAELLYAVGTGAFNRSGVVTAIILLDANNNVLGSASVTSSDWTKNYSATPPKITLSKNITVSTYGAVSKIVLRNNLADDLFVYTLPTPTTVNTGDVVKVTWDVWAEGTGNLYVVQGLLPLITGDAKPSDIQVTKAVLWYLGEAQETVSVSVSELNSTTPYVVFKASWTPSKSYNFDYIQLQTASGFVVFGISEAGNITAGTPVTLTIKITATT